MKCEICSAPVTLEDEFCPYCGALNKPARQHIEDMQRYNRDYQKTRAEVLRNVDRSSRRHGYILAILALVVLNVVVFTAQFFDYEIEDLRRTLQVRRNATAYEREMAAMEAAGDYSLMQRVYNREWLYDGSENLRSYNYVCDMAGDLERIEDNLFYLCHPEVPNYMEPDEELDRLANYIVYFYENWKWQDESYSQQYFAEPHLAAMKDMKRCVETELQRYAGLTDEEIEKLPDMKKTELLLLLGRRFGIYE